MVKKKWFPVSGFVSRAMSGSRFDLLVSGRLVSWLFIMLLLLPAAAFTQSKSYPSDKFKQMDDLLPTPNEQRTASGAPANRYWQQRADYDIKVELDDTNQRLSASGKPIPTILITAYPDDGVRERALSAGVVGYLSKPFEEDDLLACVRSALTRPLRGR